MIFFNPTCDPVHLEDAHLNSLSWADDLVLFSRTPEGLQTCIDKLELYCDTWELEVQGLCQNLSKCENCADMLHLDG